MKHEIVDNVYINENFKELYNTKQDVSHRILDKIPAPNDIREGEIVFCIVGNNVKLFTKVRGKLYNISLM